MATAKDVFDLPPLSTTLAVGSRFWNVLTVSGLEHQNHFLLKALLKNFFIEFLCIGVLKFVADCAAFASPLLLNKVRDHSQIMKHDFGEFQTPSLPSIMPLSPDPYAFA